MNRSRTLLTAALAALTLAVSPPASPAQPAAEVSPAAAQGGLPSGVPRSMRAYTHVFIAFSVAWLLLFGYTVSVGRRLGRLEDELRRHSTGE